MPGKRLEEIKRTGNSSYCGFGYEGKNVDFSKPPVISYHKYARIFETVDDSAYGGSGNIDELIHMANSDGFSDILGSGFLTDDSSSGTNDSVQGY